MGVPATAAEPETRAALRRLVGRGHWPAGAMEVYPYLGHLLSLQLEGEAGERVKLLDPQALPDAIPGRRCASCCAPWPSASRWWSSSTTSTGPTRPPPICSSSCCR